MASVVELVWLAN